ncbi:hypothetical protein NSA56_01895 [Oceanobacillus caeni]|uniref:hypothetical protein n=1 Tax=Bacillaceae TaxID=186817 RepID=UPI0011A28561|nr:MULTISPECIES: hypothetical protein [Bacillaceae]MCR1833149.1 hypothetical protein [Oceanobacillus caeni]
MYVYKIVQTEHFDDGDIEKETFFLSHEKKYDDGDFEELVYYARNYLRNKYNYVTGHQVVKVLENDGFKKLTIQAEDEFELENYW